MDSSKKSSVQQRYEIFEKQDVENGKFDVTFKFNDGQVIHTHKALLTSISDAFVVMFNENWNKKEFVEIHHNTFDEFKNFLNYCYLGASVISEDNVMILLDFAECYGIKELKEECDEFICNDISVDIDNVTEYFNVAHTYLLSTLNAKVKQYFKNKTSEVVKSDAFLTGQKEIVMAVASLERISIPEGQLFSAILEWVKKRSINAQDIESHLKNELKDFLPLIRFPTMNPKYFAGTVVKEYSYLLEISEIADILLDALERKENGVVENPHSKYSCVSRHDGRNYDELSAMIKICERSLAYYNGQTFFKNTSTNGVDEIIEMARESIKKHNNQM